MKRHHLIMGTAIGLAAILTAIDHTKHKLPVAEEAPKLSGQENIIVEGDDEASPCSLGEDSSPCGLGD